MNPFKPGDKEPEVVEEWKSGWKVKNNQSNAEHEVVAKIDKIYLMKSLPNKHSWSLTREYAHGFHLKNGVDCKNYSVISKEETLTELPCIKIIPPVNIPERKEIQQGELYPYSFFQVQSGFTSQVYISMYSNGAWMSKNSLRKTAQAMNILASILEENEKDNG